MSFNVTRIGKLGIIGILGKLGKIGITIARLKQNGIPVPNTKDSNGRSRFEQSEQLEV